MMNSAEGPVARDVSEGPDAAAGRPGLFTTEFISDTAHELRAPLTSIKGYVDYLLDGVAGDLNPVQRDFLERARVNTVRLMTLLGDLFDLMRTDAGRVVPCPGRVSLEGVLVPVLSEIESTASHRGIELTVEGASAAVVWADREMVHRLLLTLMRRAVSRAPDHGRVWAHIDVESPNAVVVAVRDTGTAPVERSDALFATFEGLPATTSRDERTGLELPIAKALVEAQGGRIWAEAQSGSSCAICFTLPAAAREAGE